jgi:luciferase family oxidoreductase group 1
MKFSVLDQSPVSVGKTPYEAMQETIKLAQETEKLGFSRYWVSEHHSIKSLAGSSPEVLISSIAAHTSRIRVGSGGVLLPHYSSYKVAENFRVLETLYPNRINLGIGRAPGGMPNVTRALQDNGLRSINRYPEQVEELIAYLNGEDPKQMGVHATPSGTTVPELWLLGSSGGSAMLAAEMGMPFMFAQFINGFGGPAVAEQYKEQFKPSVYHSEPKVSVTIFVFCAGTEEEAEELAYSLDLRLLLLEQGKSGAGILSAEDQKKFRLTAFDKQRIAENRSRMIVGDPDQVKQQLEQLSKDYGADEIMINTITRDFKDRMKSYQLIAESFK